MARFDARPLHSAIEGLIDECSGIAEPTMIQHWVDLIHGYVLRFAKPMQRDDRLQLLWERVVAHLSEHWTLPRLAQEAGYSNEHLRRLCRRQLCATSLMCWSRSRKRRQSDSSRGAAAWKSAMQ